MSQHNTYIADPESEAEKARLSRQGQLLTKALGLFPPHLDVGRRLSVAQQHFRILDVGCGTGEWSLTVAAKYPVEVIGVDISQRMVAYANAEAENRETPNACFQVMNALEPMGFPSGSFDIVHIRIALAFVPREQWQALFREGWRLLRSGGTLISTESEGSLTNCYNPATARMNHWLCQALWMRGLGFWDGVGSLQGIHSMQPLFLRNAGFQDIQQHYNVLDTSFGTADYWAWLEHHKITLQAIEPVVCGLLGVSKEMFDATLDAGLRESRLDTYASRTWFLTATGCKER